jgi:chaperonin GroEL (HSP60 family)
MVSELQTLYTESQDGMTKLARTVREKILTDEPVKEDELIDQLEQTAIEIGDLLSSPFGPRGMNKIIVNPVRDIFVTSDGKVILKEMDVLHPIVTTFKKLAEATGTTLMAQQDEIHPEDLGKADSIRVEKKNGENFVYITVRERGIASILIREPVKYGLDKVEEAIDDALNNVAFLMKNKEIVNGRGAIEF